VATPGSECRWCARACAGASSPHISRLLTMQVLVKRKRDAWPVDSQASAYAMAAPTTSGNEALRSRNDDFSEGLAAPEPEADTTAAAAHDPAFAEAVAALPPAMTREAYVRWRDAAAARVAEVRDAGLVKPVAVAADAARDR
jgi:hypothetical protein